MTKEEFLSQLRRELSFLEQEEIEEILRDQEEFIHEAVDSGRKEEDVIRSLGSPQAFARSIKMEHKFKKINTSDSLTDKMKELPGLLVLFLALTPLVFFIGIGPGLILLICVTFLFLLSSIAILAAVFATFGALVSGGLSYNFFGMLFLTLSMILGCVAFTYLISALLQALTYVCKYIVNKTNMALRR